MTFLAGILTVLLIATCVVLIFLVLVQLPKKDAGAGVAFGGGAADALFGAGSGNALTKITKWATGIFFALALLLGFTEERLHRSNATEFEKGVGAKQNQLPIAAPPSTRVPAATTATNQLFLPPVLPATNAPTATATNAPAASPQPN